MIYSLDVQTYGIIAGNLKNLAVAGCGDLRMDSRSTDYTPPGSIDHDMHLSQQSPTRLRVPAGHATKAPSSHKDDHGFVVSMMQGIHDIFE
jgi:hypothetical protein